MKKSIIATSIALMLSSTMVQAGSLNPIPYGHVFPKMAADFKAGTLTRASMGGRYTVPPVPMNTASNKVDVLEEKFDVELIVAGQYINFHKIFYRANADDYVFTRVRIGDSGKMDVYMTSQTTVTGDVVYAEAVVRMPNYTISPDGQRGNDQGLR